MKNFFNSRKSVLVWTAAAAILASCSGGKQDSNSSLADSAHFQPAPTGNEASVESRLKRYAGQTLFLNPSNQWNGPMMARSATAESAALGGAKSTERRAIQESDIFKVGKPGSDLLFLLNGARGLQVVSFAKGADHPELVGRVAPTGNYPDTMYYDAAQDRLVVVERVWTDDSGNNVNWEEQRSRLLIYDVSKPSSPVISQQVEFKGEAADSRMVGDVLYVATSLRPVQNRWSNLGTDKPEGHVYSYKLGQNIELVATKKLALPTYRDNMNIVEVEAAGGGYKYYLVATLSNSQWGWWWDRNSAIEVVDISSASGEIVPVMLAPVKGRINERSSTIIKNDTLVVASNYQSEEGQKLQRIAVETYRFPTGNKSELLSSDEVKFRRMYIDREVKRALASGSTVEQLAALRTALENNADLGLSGKFEQTEAGNTEKLLPDSVVTVGDSRGQHASLQDVRFDGDLMYVFWVPANMIDPLDVFDISKPESSIAHLGHLEFEGWVERSFPITFNNKRYLLGLGTVVPTVNNERGQRHPQARLIEIKKLANGKVKAVDTADLTFQDSNVWAQFNGDDKAVELQMNDAEKGQGTILFRVDQWTEKKYVSGGKLIAFDLSKADEGDVFAEGGLLKAEWGWLKRVFSNPELKKFNTFSDEELRVYDAQNAGRADEIFNAIGVLELARDVKSYVSLSSNLGVQIVGKGRDSYWYNTDSNATTELRLVSAVRGDEEVASVKSVLKLDGEFQSQIRVGNELIVATRTTKTVEKEENGVKSSEQEARFNLYAVRVSSGKLVNAANTSFVGQPQQGGFSSFSGRMMPRRWLSWSNLEFTKLNDGSLYATIGAEIRMIALSGETLSAKVVETEACDLTNAHEAKAQFLNGQPVMTWSQQVGENGEVIAVVGQPITGFGNPSRESQWTAHYVSKLVAVAGSAEPKLACQSKTNVPGTLMNFEGDSVLTRDNRLIDRVKHEDKLPNGEVRVWYNDVTKPVLASLKLKNQNVAALVDMYDAASDSENRWSNALDTMKPISGNRLVFVEGKDWENQNSTHTFSTLSIDTTGRILKESKVVELGVNNAQLSALISKNGTHIGVLRSGRQVQVVRWSDQESRPVVLKLKQIGVNFKAGKATNVVVLPGYAWYGDDAKIDHDAVRNTLNFAQGLSGVSQVILAK